MVTWASIVGVEAGIPDIIMGLTFLAAGTSVPDLLSSVVVARQVCPLWCKYGGYLFSLAGVGRWLGNV